MQKQVAVKIDHQIGKTDAPMPPDEQKHHTDQSGFQPYKIKYNLNQVAIHANTYGVYSEEIAVLQKDYAALWEPLSDLLEKLAEVVDM